MSRLRSLTPISPTVSQRTLSDNKQLRELDARTQTMDFCFVNMPYAPVERPPLGIGLLQAVLEENGFSTSAVHANIPWCEHVGVPLYTVGERAQYLFGDWTFSPAAFPGFEPDSESYLRSTFHQTTLRLLGIKQEDLSEFGANLRRKAIDFVDETAHRIIALNPLIVGCSSTYMAHVSSLALLRRIRELAPGIVTMMGGANCESVMGLTTHENFPWVDYVISGEADHIIVDLVRAIRDKGREVGLHNLPTGAIGPIHRTSRYSGMRDNPPRASAESLEGLPTPSYDDYFIELGKAPVLSEVVQPGLPVEGSRGCWWGSKQQCTFCGLNGRALQYRTRPIDQVVKDVETLERQYGINRIGFADNILNPVWFTTLFPTLAAHNRSYRISCESTPRLTKDQVRAMAEAGVELVQPGIESLDPAMLDLLNKGTKAWLNIRFLKWCLYYGIDVLWFLLDQVPRQDNGWYANTGDLLRSLCHLQPPRRLYSIIYSRFGRYHENPDAYDLDLQPMTGYSVIYPLSSSEINRIAYYFEDAGGYEGSDEKEIEEDNRTEQKALLGDLAEWMKLFYSDERPMLWTLDTGTEILIRDTRPGAVETSYHLSGGERAVYLACEDGIQPERLHGKFADKGHTDPAIEAIVTSLLDRRLVILLDSHLLSLGVPEPLRSPWPRTAMERLELDRVCGAIDNALYNALILIRGSRPGGI
jgi:ribosomal peptide maturation radical SAM protein 1